MVESMSDDIERPWEQQSGETDKAYRAFCAYLLLGPGRSIDAAWRQQGRSKSATSRAPGHWTRWSSKHNWAERASVHDQHAARQAIEAQEDSLKSLVAKVTRAASLSIDHICGRLENAENSIPVEFPDAIKALNATTNAIHRLGSLTGAGQPQPVSSVRVVSNLYDTPVDFDELGDSEIDEEDDDAR